jgi:hypothetical protein
MRELSPNSEEEWYDIIKEKRERLRDLILDEDGRLISREELIERLVDIGVEVYEEDDTTHYVDKTLDKRVEKADNTTVKAKTVEWPVSRADRLVKMGRHPDELESVDEKAKKMEEFDEVLSEEFNR